MMAASLSSFAVAGGDLKEVEPAVVPVVPMAEEEKSPWYAGLAIAYNQTYSTDYGFFDDSVRTQDETGKIVGNLGYNFNEYIAVEGRIGASIFEEDYADVMIDNWRKKLFSAKLAGNKKLSDWRETLAHVVSDPDSRMDKKYLSIVASLPRYNEYEERYSRLADAHELVKTIEVPFDFVFSDADKGWYTQYFKDVDPKLKVGGCFTAHNVANTYGGAQEFMDYIRDLSNYTTTVDNSSGSGISISYKKSD